MTRKPVVFSALLCLLLFPAVGSAAARSLSARVLPRGESPTTVVNAPNGGCGTSEFTQSSSQAVTALNSVSCNDGFGHTDNSYWRAFPSANFPAGFTACEVEVGIEDAISTGGTQSITVRLYSHTGAAFPGGSRVQIGTATVNVTDQSATILDVPIAAVLPAGANLIVEVFTPDGTAAGNLFFIGSNAAAESGPSYISAADCGIANPTPTANIGFPDMHIVLNVRGTVVAGGCTLTCPLDVVQSNDANQCGAVVAYPLPQTSGTCGQVTCAPQSSAFFPVGQTTVTCQEATPPPFGVGTPASCTFLVTVNDTQPPTETAPDLVVNTDPGVCTGTATPAATASDNCPGVTSVCTPPGPTFSLGVTPVSCTATDFANNTATDNGGSVTVNDLEPPVITCPADINEDLPAGVDQGAANWLDPVVSDNCPGVGLPNCVPPSGSTFQADVSTPVSCTVLDAASNTANCTFNVLLGFVSILEIPTASGWGLAGLALLLAGAAFLVMRRNG